MALITPPRIQVQVDSSLPRDYIKLVNRDESCRVIWLGDPDDDLAWWVDDGGRQP